MVQTMKEYQKEYFEKEGYTIIDNMEMQSAHFVRDTHNTQMLRKKAY